MGAWGVGSLENDDASDWVDELADANDFEVGWRAFDAVNADYVEAPEASVALAAAEVVAAALGQPAASLPDEVTTWVDDHHGIFTRDDARRALAAVDRVIAEESELVELWNDAGDDKWALAVSHLRARLIAAHADSN